MKIILLSGKADSGKDSFYNILCEHKEQKKIKRIGFADSLKVIAKEICGWNGQKDGENRTLLIDIGQILRDEYYLDIDEEDNLAITDVFSDKVIERKTYDLINLYFKLLKSFTPKKTFWTDIFINKISLTPDFQNKIFVCTDWRFKNEYFRLKSIFEDIVTVRIIRNQFAVINDRSENDLDNFKFDYTILNDGDYSEYIEKVCQLFENIV